MVLAGTSVVRRVSVRGGHPGQSSLQGARLHIQSVDTGVQGQRASAPVRRVVCSCGGDGGEGKEGSPRRREMVGLVFQAVRRTAL